jgi:hypothetical protein
MAYPLKIKNNLPLRFPEASFPAYLSSKKGVAEIFGDMCSENK